MESRWDFSISMTLVSAEFQPLSFVLGLKMAAALVTNPDLINENWQRANLDQNICKTCSRKVPVKGKNASNLKAHLATHHPAVEAQLPRTATGHVAASAGTVRCWSRPTIRRQKSVWETPNTFLNAKLIHSTENSFTSADPGTHLFLWVALIFTALKVQRETFSSDGLWCPLWTKVFIFTVIYTVWPKKEVATWI